MIFLIGVHGQPVSFHPVRSAGEKALVTSYKAVCTLVTHTHRKPKDSEWKKSCMKGKPHPSMTACTWAI